MVSIRCCSSTLKTLMLYCTTVSVTLGYARGDVKLKEKKDSLLMYKKVNDLQPDFIVSKNIMLKKC